MFKKTVSEISTTLSTNTTFIKTNKKFMMLLHEYQAQGLLKKFSVPIPKVNFFNIGSSR